MADREQSDPEWVPMIEAIRIIARGASAIAGDDFTIKELRQAARFLERAGRENKIPAEGIRYLDDKLTLLTSQDWMRLFVRDGNTLDDPNHKMRARPVRITGVVVDAHSVRRHLLVQSARGTPDQVQLVPKATSSKPSARRGPKEKYDWPAVEEAFLKRVEIDGWPDNFTNEDGWQHQSHVETWVAHKLNGKPGEATIRRHVSAWMKKHMPT